MNLKFGDVGRFLSFSINKSNARSIEYLHAFELTPSSSMLPYEPFLTVLREYLTQDDAEAALHDAGTPKRYGKLLLAWIFNKESYDYEPTLPSQYIYEQLIVTRAVASLLHKLASNHVIHLNITNTQYLSASSCNLLHNLDSDWPAQFGITLSLTPEALNAWWPTEDQQRYLKLRFRMSAALTQPDELASQYTLSVSTVPNTQTMKWADITYCGTELYALAEYLLHNKDCNTKDEAYSFYCNYMMLNAKTYSNSASDAHALINLLKAEDWAQYSPELIFSAHIAIFKSHVWFKNNADAFQTASQLLEWSEISGLPNQTLYAKFLHFWSLYLSGNFQYNHAEVKQLDEELQAIGWQQLRAAVISTFWFDLNAIQINGDYFLQRCQTARDIIALDNNPLAMATHCHHFSIIQQHLGDIEGAIASLSQSVELATPLGLTERMHHALNGKAYLLACCGEFDAAATIVLQALPLVIQDENHEQICTTLCNAAITTYFAGQFKDTISLIEEIFTIFHLRGILHTRHRSNFELRAIQSVCRLLMGNTSVAIESHSLSQRDEPQSMEGSVTIQLMDLAVRLNQGHCINEDICTLIHTSRDIHHSNMIELLIHRFVFSISNKHPELLEYVSNELPFETNNNGDQLAFTEFSIFSELPEDGPCSQLHDRVLAFDLITKSRQASLNDFINLENSLLKLVVGLNNFSQNCSNPIELFDFLITRMARTLNINFVSLEVNFNQLPYYKKDIELHQNQNEFSLPVNYPFSFSEGHGNLKVLFGSSSDLFSKELSDWCHKIAKTTSDLIESIIHRQKSVGLAYFDTLTGAKNRAAYENIDSQYDLRSLTNFTLVYLDLDNFKVINDQFGHDRGDQILKQFSSLIIDSITSEDSLYRIGGDEFFIFIPSSRVEESVSIIKNLIETFTNKNQRKSDYNDLQTPQLSCSAGLLNVYGYIHDSTSIRKLTILADELMYQAKKSGKNTLVHQSLSFVEALEQFRKTKTISDNEKTAY